MASWTISEADFMSAVGDAEDKFNVMSGLAGSSAVWGGFGTGDIPSSVSEAGNFRLVRFRIVLIASPLSIMFH